MPPTLLTSHPPHDLISCAQRTSMFDDPAGEVDELTGLIKQDIQVRLWGGKGGVV